MKTNALDLLEYEGLRQVLGRYVRSPLGAAELAKIAPHSGRAALERSLAETAEAIAYLEAVKGPQPTARGAAIRLRFESLPPVATAVQILHIEGASLDPFQIFDLNRLLDYAAEARSILNATSEKFPLLGARAAQIADFRPLLRELQGKILPDRSVADDASPALHKIRREIDRQRKQIEIALDRFLRTHREDGTLQEDFVTIRNDRFVVPVIAGQQRRVDGVIHAESGTGHTLFVEPLETIQMNNELVRLREEEIHEIHRILAELTARLRVHAGAISAAVEALAALELVFAKAEFAGDFRCTVPRFAPELARRLAVRNARHPLLEDVLRRQGKPVVPLTLQLDETCRTLLISGPNTGGKTVSMKTIGLLALMAHSGLPVPADEAEFPLFEQVLADIGDSQSIAESLSSFSSHIVHIREMLLDVTPDSLVLLDELGSATDPEEGGALGVAILDTFRSTRAFTLASTHLLALKIYGANTEGVLNASMGFNEETFQPTYVLRTGAPGKSAGLHIATRLGLPDYLIQKARSVMSTEARDIARFLTELHERIERAARSEREFEQQKEALAKREQALAREYERKHAELRQEMEQRCAAALTRFEQQARETIGRITEQADQRKTAELAMRRVAKTRREFEEDVRSSILPPQTPAAKPPPAIEEGTRIRLKGVREPATVRRKLGDGRLEVQAGLLKMQVAAEDVETVLPPAPEASRLPGNVTFQSGPAWNVSYREINVIGRSAEEARDEIDKFLDSAALASIDRVRIVHGHGMGILKRAVADLLSDHPHVEKFYPASPAEGGTGATVAELR